MIKKYIDFVFTIFVLLFLTLTFLFTFIRERETYSYFENRALAPFPSMSAHGISDGSSFSEMETYLSDHAPGRNTALRLRTWVDLCLLRRPVVNDVVVLRDEHVLLPYTSFEYESDTLNQNYIEIKSERIADSLAGHSSLVESYGGYFCYVAVPCQYVCYMDAYPSYLNNRKIYTERSTAALFEKLDERGVSYIDLRQVYGDKIREYSSTVDNHYSIHGAFAAYQALMERIDADTDLALPIPETADFKSQKLGNPYFGAMIRKLCGLWTTEEKLYTLTPLENIPYRRYIRGEYISDSVYSLPENDNQPIQYTAYMSGDIGESLVDTGRENLPSVLIYGDSFTNAMECVLWYSFDTMRSYDFRHYTEHTLDELIQMYQPDVVVCVRDLQQILTETANGM